MKEYKISFIFLYFLAINIVCGLNHDLLSQNIKDSTFIPNESKSNVKDVNTTDNTLEFYKNQVKESLLKNDSTNTAYYQELIYYQSITNITDVTATGDAFDNYKNRIKESLLKNA